MTNADIIFRGNATSAATASRSAATGVTSVGRAAKGAGHELQTATGHADAFGHSIKHIAALTIGTLGLHELVHGLREAVNAAGDVEKQQSKVVRVFGETPKVLEQFEKSSAKAYGISHLAALKAVSSSGALLTNLGVGPKYAAGLSIGMQKLSADVASFNDLPTAVVADRVNKALLGQTRGLKSLGISLSQTDVNAKALAIGLVKPVKSADGLRAATDKVTVAERKYGEAVRDHGKESKEALTAEAGLIAANKAHASAVDGVVPKLTAQQQALATLALIYERSKKQQGDFQRNQDKIANSSKVLDAEFADLSDRVGNALEPSIKSLVEFMAGPGIAGANAFLTRFGNDATDVYDAVKPLAPAAHAAGSALVSLNDAGALKGLLAGAIAYQGLTRSISLGNSAIGSAKGLIISLRAPFDAIGAGAQAAEIKYSGFGGQIRTVEREATKGVSPLRALAGSAGAVGLAAGIAVGTLVAFESAEESIGQKARAAADDLRGLQDAQAGFAGAKTDVKRTGLDQGDAARALINANRDLAGAQDRAHAAQPDTAAGDRAHAAALVDLAVKTRAAARAQNEYDSAHEQHVAAEKAVVKAREDVAASTDKAVKKINDLAAANENQARIAITRGEPAAKVAIAQQADNEAALRKTTAAISAQIKANQEIRPKSAAGFQAILDLVNTTKKLPEKKTLSILLNDAATGKIAALKRQIATLEGKTVTIVEQTRGTVFARRDPVTGKPLASGGIIDRPQVAMVGEEAPSHPEFVIPTNPARRGRALGLISQMRSWIPGFADGAGPPETLAQQEARARASTPAKASTAKKATATSGSRKASTDHRPAWMKHWQDDQGSKLPGDDAFNNAVARAQANLDDAGRTAMKSDDIRALHALIRISSKRLPALHSLRGVHKEAIWQTAVNSQISSVDGQLAGYRSSLVDAVKKPGPDDITVSVPSAIAWGIEKAGFSDSPGDDVSAQKRKRAWLLSQLNAKDKKGKYKLPLNSAKRIAFSRELARTNAELATLGQQVSDDKQAADEAAAQTAATAPEVPSDIQEALANAALTPGTGDDLAALQSEQAFLQNAIATEDNQTARIALKQSLADVNGQIDSIVNPSGSSGDTGPSADDQALLTQAQTQRDVALRGLALAGAEIQAFGSSGDIGTSNFGSAFDAARGGPTLAILGDSRSLMAIGNAAVQGMGAQPSVNSNRVFVGV